MPEISDQIRSRQRTYVAMSQLHGRGVFATGPIAAGDIIEECPVLRFPAAEREDIGATIVDEYYFEWAGDGAIALGFGSLYNHSDTPVAEYIKDTDNDRLIVRAVVDIAADQEITFHYSGPEFDVRNRGCSCGHRPEGAYWYGGPVCGATGIHCRPFHQYRPSGE